MSRPLLWLQVVAVATAAALWFTHMHACGPEPQVEHPPAASRSLDPPGDVQWSSFKRQHPHVALASELAVLWAISPPTLLRDIADQCAGDDPASLMIARSSFAAVVRIREREVRVERVMCRSAHGAGDNAELIFCDCLLARLPRDGYARLPTDIPDTELVPYSGTLTLTDLRIN